MPEFVQLGTAHHAPLTKSARIPPGRRTGTILWLQGITLAWMLAECAGSLYAAATARSPVVLAFGCDSLIELFSATVVLLQHVPRFPLSQNRANRISGVLLFALAGVVACIAILALALQIHPGTSPLALVVTTLALIVMPVLAWLKNREAGRSGNAALRADAVQSATCAYLAGITITGLAANALFKIAWLDSIAALVAVPILIREGRAAWRGQTCECC